MVTKRLQIPADVPGLEEQPCRNLQVGVTSAELTPAMTGLEIYRTSDRQTTDPHFTIIDISGQMDS